MTCNDYMYLENFAVDDYLTFFPSTGKTEEYQMQLVTEACPHKRYAATNYGCIECLVQEREKKKKSLEG